MSDFIIKISQILSYFIFYIPRRILFDVSITRSHNFGDIKKGILLVANHQSKLDPFLVLSCIPFNLFFRILPIRFPVMHEYMKRPFLVKILKILGCYDIGKTSRENMIGFFYTRDILKKGKTIFLFPEGKISRNGDEMANLKRGIEFFVKESKNVVFARLKGFNNTKGLPYRVKSSITFSSIQNLAIKDADMEDIKMVFSSL